jgi:integrase
MRLLIMLPVRPAELVQMRWEDVDLVGADWRYVVSKTKHLDKSKHIVPLPEQALVLLRELHKTRRARTIKHPHRNLGSEWYYSPPRL